MRNKVRKLEKPFVKRVEMEQMEADAEKAKAILTGDEFKFFRDWLNREKDDIVNDFINNRILKIVEVRPQELGGEIQITHTKEEQSAELSGQFKFIYEIFAQLQFFIDLPKQTIENAEHGLITIEGKDEKND